MHKKGKNLTFAWQARAPAASLAMSRKRELVEPDHPQNPRRRCGGYRRKAPKSGLSGIKTRPNRCIRKARNPEATDFNKNAWQSQPGWADRKFKRTGRA